MRIKWVLLAAVLLLVALVTTHVRIFGIKAQPIK